MAPPRPEMKTPQSVPKNWPPHIIYLTTPIYTNLTPSQRNALRIQPEPTSRTQPLPEIPPTLSRGTPSSKVSIRPITDPSHPANGQCGLFAAASFPPGAFIVPYWGEYHTGSGRLGAPFAKSDYDLWLDRIADVAIDADRAGSEARFVNDYRGTGKEKANAEFREVWDPRRGERAIAVFVVRSGGGKGGGKWKGIARGEEIVVSYGKGFWEKRLGKDVGKEVTVKDDEGDKKVEQEAGKDTTDEDIESVDAVANGIETLEITN